MRKKRKKSLIIPIIIILFLIVVISIVFIINNTQIKEENIRKAVFAGSWYPANKQILENSVQEYLNNSNKLDFTGRIKAVIVPHAGYFYSGQVAASAFKQLEEEYETVFLIGPSHKYYLENVSVSGFKYFSTPLGNVKLSEKAKEINEKEKIISEIEEAHENEHSLEIELPFLQTQLKDFKIVPLIVGPTNTTKLKDILIDYVGEKDLIVVSVDLSHYHEYNEAITLDSNSINNILELNDEKILDSEIDAPWAVSSLLKIAKEKSWKPYLIAYSNSGDISADKESVVGYSAIVFVEEKSFSDSEKRFLLNLARESAEDYLKKGKKIEIDEKDVPENIKEKKGCFVTFTKDEQLRGCIGYILPEKPLYECVIENSINAAVKDSRFSPVNSSELEDIIIDISVLSVPTLFEHKNYEELLVKLGQDKYGVVLINGMHQSTFLPSVWEFIPDKQNFLASLCIKGGMKEDCGKDNKTEVYLYTAEDFSE